MYDRKKNQSEKEFLSYLNHNFLRASRLIRQKYRSFIGAGLRLHGVPHSRKFQPEFLRLTSTQYCFGRPFFLLPSGVHPRATVQSIVGSYLMWNVEKDFDADNETKKKIRKIS